MKYLLSFWLLILVHLNYGQTNQTFTGQFPLVNVKDRVINDAILDSRELLYYLCDTVLVLEKEAIPILIEEMDNPEIFLGISLLHPYKSTITASSNSYHFKGLLAAYLIEFILQRDNSGKPTPSGANHIGMKRIDWYYLKMSSNLILKKEKEEALSYSDIGRLKQIYIDWWELNKTKSIEELRKQNAKQSIFNNTPFVWK